MSNPGPAITTSIHPQLVNSNQAIRLLAVQQGVNLNQTGDTVIPVINTTTYSVANVVLTNASTSITSAQIGVFSGANKGGTAIVTTTSISALTSSTVVDQLTVASTALQTSQNLYLNVVTAQGAPATADAYVYGYDFSQSS